MLKIGLVARCLNTSHIRGMGKYVFEVLKQSQKVKDIQWYLFADDNRERMTFPDGINAEIDIFEFRGDRFHLWEQIGLPLRAIRSKIDVLHCTESTLPLWQPKPTVVTVHDTLMWDDNHQGMVEKFYFNWLLPRALKKCSAIITISESSKNDILEKWPCLVSKLNVIPHGIEDEYFMEENSELPGILQKQIGGEAYIVYMGGVMERKRFAWALNVLSQSNNKAIKMVACGFGETARENEIKKLPQNLKEQVCFAEFLSDSELRALYRGAEAVFYPTLYEGFGFPAIEAQAAGVPVFFSALGSLTELIGPLAIVLPPFEINDWVSALHDVLAMSKKERADKVEDARQWVIKFRWSESADKHLVVYRRVTGENLDSNK